MGNDNSYALDMYGNPPRVICECCAPRMVSMTSTYATHKWTRKEIEDEIFETASQLATATFWNRAELLKRLKHWTAKRDRLQELENEFSS